MRPDWGSESFNSLQVRFKLVMEVMEVMEVMSFNSLQVRFKPAKNTFQGGERYEFQFLIGTL